MKRARDRNILIHSYCVCRMPQYYVHHMPVCEKCDEWYHYKCVGIDSSSHPDSFNCKLIAVTVNRSLTPSSFHPDSFIAAYNTVITLFSLMHTSYIILFCVLSVVLTYTIFIIAAIVWGESPQAD